MVAKAAPSHLAALLLDFKLSQHCSKKDLSTAIQQILCQLTDPLLEGLSIVANLWCARKHLCEICCQAQALHQEYLDSLVKQANQVNDEQWRKLILHLKRAKENCCVFALVKQCMKPQSAGISCLIIPHQDHPEGVTLHNPKDIKAVLMQNCQAHFRKAHGSPIHSSSLVHATRLWCLNPFWSTGSWWKCPYWWFINQPCNSSPSQTPMLCHPNSRSPFSRYAI